MASLKHATACAIGLLLSLGAGTAAAEVVAVVSAGSAVTQLSRNQIADIFMGKLNRFPNGEPATPIDHPEGSAERDEFYERYAGRSAAQMKAHWAKIIFTGRGQPPATAAGGAAVKKRLAVDPNGIGYIDAKLVDASVRVIEPR